MIQLYVCHEIRGAHGEEASDSHQRANIELAIEKASKLKDTVISGPVFAVCCSVRRLRVRLPICSPIAIEMRIIVKEARKTVQSGILSMNTLHSLGL